MNRWGALLARPGVILADGAMGTVLFEAGLQFGDPPEAWNVEHPERVRAVHRAYLEAGSRILLTNTFGGSRFRLALHNLSARAGELNRAAAENLRAVVDEFDGVAVVGGDVGPSGEIMAPLGTLDYADAVAGFAEQAAGLIEGGVDVIWIETMSDLAEMQAAIEGTRRVSPTIPIVATMTFDTHGHTMMGVSPEKAANALASWGVAALGANCGNGPNELLAVLPKMRAAQPDAVLVAKSNAGVPQLVKGQAVYSATPEDMARYAVDAEAAGARIIGACCGSTPAHVRAMAWAGSHHRDTEDTEQNAKRKTQNANVCGRAIVPPAGVQ
jgi:5-methyltetrahydrofolate--homocysteine methyltransferase